MKNIYFYETDIGEIGIADNGESITNLYFGRKNINEDFLFIETEIIKDAMIQLKEYFSGDRKHFDIKLQPKGTEFMTKVWNELTNIPYGKTCSYGEIAKLIGNAKACRAIGLANNKNPIPIFIPCHRVIGANGKLVGYAGGLEIKKHLLNLENINL